ncbi:MAG: DUF1707 domain-containing protein [Streptosporangiales bacterium]|nr:DUF1707 domain-containing protein [Streptosporangiales bacterium]MBO0892691.1 DUF1707 domain-containing protein [Acidothermales bacterium]
MADDPKSPQLRASDADRERIANELRDHYADGRLTMEEFDERIESVYKAKTYGELAPVTADLPAPPPDPAVQKVEARRRRIAALRAVWGSWASVALICTVIWLLVSISGGGFHYFWPGWVIGPWGAMILAGTLGRGRNRTGPGDDRQQLHGQDQRRQARLEQRRQHMEWRMQRFDERRTRRHDH